MVMVMVMEIIDGNSKACRERLMKDEREQHFISLYSTAY